MVCNYCGFQIRGSIDRLKYYLAQISSHDVQMYNSIELKVIQEIKDLISNYVKDKIENTMIIKTTTAMMNPTPRLETDLVIPLLAHRGRAHPL